MVTVIDTNSATATAPFTLTIDSAVVATQSIASTSLTVYQPAATFTPVTGSGGDASLIDSVSPALPTGLSLSSSTGTISGSPTASSAATTYTVTVTDTNSATATATFGLVVNRQTSTTIASVGQSSITPIQSVTLTATVAATITGTPIVPSGMVTFFDGTTHLESPVSVTNGVATLLVSALPSGETATITATYSGDGNFLASASNTSAITVTVAPLDSTFTTTGTTAYTLAPGAVATYTFALSPFYGSYVGPVSFAVTGLPAGATASFTPNSVPAMAEQPRL